MKFLQLIVIENDTTDEQEAALRDGIIGWYEETVERGVGVVVGKPLAEPRTAKTIRVRKFRDF